MPAETISAGLSCNYEGPFTPGQKCACTLFRSADIINRIIDDELEVLIQQSVYQRGVGYTLSICQKRTNL